MKWTGFGCDVCGFGTVEDVDLFDPTEPCPKCGSVMISHMDALIHEMSLIQSDLVAETALRYNMSKGHKRYFNVQAGKNWPKAVAALKAAMPEGSKVSSRSMLAGAQRTGFVVGVLPELEIRAKLQQSLKLNPDSRTAQTIYFPAMDICVDLHPTGPDAGKYADTIGAVKISISSEKEMTKLSGLARQLKAAVKVALDSAAKAKKDAQSHLLSWDKGVRF